MTAISTRRTSLASEREPRIGLFFCHCGPNIAEVIQLSRLASADWPEAAHICEASVLCSKEGKAFLEEQIREGGLERVVVVGCSPREHEATFRAVLNSARLEPFNLQMVNVREQGEWLGGPPRQATARARALVRAALRRVARHEPIPVTEVEVSPDAVVVGGGVAGLRAALTMAQKGRRVTLVERDFVLGGLVSKLDELFPRMECASCFMDPLLDRVLHHSRIDVLMGAEVVGVLGSAGNFTIRIRQRPRRVNPTACKGCPQCVAACPVEVLDPDGAGTGKRKAIAIPYPGGLPHVAAVDEDACLSLKGERCSACASACPFGAVRLDEQAAERAIRCGAVVLATGHAPGEVQGAPGVLGTYDLERLLHPGGPTGGAVRRPDGAEPRSVLLAPSPAALESDAELWPGVLAKLAQQVRRSLPAVQVTVAGGLAGRMADGLRRAGVSIVPGVLAPERVSPGGDGLRAPLDGGPEMAADLVVIHAPSRPAWGAEALARRFGLATRADGFLDDQAGPLEPTATRIAGVFVAGAAGGPRSASDAIRDGCAAAGQVLSALVPGERMALEPLAAHVEAARCGACGICAAACAFGAPHLDEETGRFRIEPAHCRGCGTCAAACPVGAIAAPHFTALQISEEISGLLRDRLRPQGEPA